jgi:hypothetical protein
MHKLICITKWIANEDELLRSIEPSSNNELYALKSLALHRSVIVDEFIVGNPPPHHPT